MDIAVIIPTWNVERATKNADLLMSNSTTGNVRVALVTHQIAETKHKVISLEKRHGVVPAMAEGGKIFPKTDVLMFLHDDVEILEKGWDNYVADCFRRDRYCGLVGFGGATGLGHPDIYKIPYELQQLARYNFISNMKDWQTHGDLSKIPKRVAVLDGFCLTFSGRAYREMGGWGDSIKSGMPPHHMYDAWAACRMVELNYHTWFLPVYCHHQGGQTAVSNEYDMWAREQGFNGDLDIHQKAHRVFYDRFRGLLPLRIFNET